VVVRLSTVRHPHNRLAALSRDRVASPSPAASGANRSAARAVARAFRGIGRCPPACGGPLPTIPRCPGASAALRRFRCRKATDECGAEHRSPPHLTPRVQQPSKTNSWLPRNLGQGGVSTNTNQCRVLLGRGRRGATKFVVGLRSVAMRDQREGVLRCDGVACAWSCQDRPPSLLTEIPVVRANKRRAPGASKSPTLQQGWQLTGLTTLSTEKE
jgi:hypothetical protein